MPCTICSCVHVHIKDWQHRRFIYSGSTTSNVMCCDVTMGERLSKRHFQFHHILMNLQSFIDQNVFIRHEYYFKKKKTGLFSLWKRNVGSRQNQRSCQWQGSLLSCFFTILSTHFHIMFSVGDLI